MRLPRLPICGVQDCARISDRPQRLPVGRSIHRYEVVRSAAGLRLPRLPVRAVQDRTPSSHCPQRHPVARPIHRKEGVGSAAVLRLPRLPVRAVQDRAPVAHRPQRLPVGRSINREEDGVQVSPSESLRSSFRRVCRLHGSPGPTGTTCKETRRGNEEQRPTLPKPRWNAQRLHALSLPQDRVCAKDSKTRFPPTRALNTPCDRLRFPQSETVRFRGP